MNTLLPKWYRPVTLTNLNEGTFKNRIADIKKIVKAKSLEWLYDCLRIYLEKPLEKDTVVKDLKAIFGKTDSFFLLNDSTLELQILCGAIIYEAIISSQSIEKNKLALVTVSAIFIMPGKILNNDIIDTVSNYIKTEGDTIRNKELKVAAEIPVNFDTGMTDVSMPVVSKKFEELFKAMKQQHQQVNQKILNAYRTINFLGEESNLLWWSFGSYSEGQKRTEIDKYVFPFVVGKELADRVITIPPAKVTYEFLKKAISESPHNEVSEIFADFINGISIDFCNRLADDYDQELSNLLPIHFALYQRKETGDNKAWVTVFENKTLLKADVKVSIFDFTKQFITECLIIKNR